MPTTGISGLDLQGKNQVELSSHQVCISVCQWFQQVEEDRYWQEDTDRQF